ncbi:hypothetical protein CI109_105008 [Kwoniella shandongensis]|uniref:Uncharacterized protein n=1 Tax=Kwoniella shandongensis TaxID=1734106 RepID=A0A5M6BWW5_9TREE|nr:uncharacterized protein CI109_004395 [Kwoniella shandongensis]KAA5527334.1 hypothetical protein CI109_004395 [Kwoniella shandongensis]
MPPSRTRRNQASQSSSQSQSLRRSSRKSASQQVPPSNAGEDETFHTSISSATLPNPDRYTITLALPTEVELTSSQAHEAYIRGEEILSDGWRRGPALEGRLSELRRQSTRRVHLPGEIGKFPALSGQVKKDDLQTLWYTAGLSFPCVCSLERLARAYTPSHPPPIRATLPPLPPHPNPSQIPRVGSYLFPWSSTQSITDLDPTLDELEDFELLWRDVKPSIAVRDDSQVTETERESPESRRMRKGKFRASDIAEFSENDIFNQLLPIRQPTSVPGYQSEAVSKVDLPPVQRVEGEGDLEKQDDWAEETKRRKSYWRKEIRSDPAYGSMWNFLPLPYSYPVRHFSPKAKVKRKSLPPIPEFQLFRKYQSIPHPFHPNLHLYIKSNPRGRVYWLIPIHGPVLIPTLNHPLSPLPSTLKMSESPPIPSRAVLYADTTSTSEKEDEVKPKSIHWTSELLLRFIATFLHPLYLDPALPFNNVSYAFSGPKPDPFLDLPSPPPLKSHLHLPPPREDELLDMTRMNPVRVEAGDHLRIYCDAKKALALRTWLHNVKIPSSSSTTKKDGQGVDADEHESVRVFYKTRLVLVGERGEVLIVA